VASAGQPRIAVLAEEREAQSYRFKLKDLRTRLTQSATRRE
jgi:hypothetical protein